MTVDRLRGLAAAGGAALVLLLGAVACSSSSSSSSAAPASSASVLASASTASFCAAWADLKTSVTKLTSSSTLTSGVGGIRLAIQDVQTNLAAVAGAAPQLGPEVDQLKSALSAVTATISGLPSGGLSAALSSLRAELANVTTAADSLASKAKQTCASPS